MSNIYRMQRGFSLVTAIFLLVVIAALGAFAVTISTTQQQSAALDLLGARAYQAARAGIEWGVYQIVSAPAGVPPPGIACPAGGASNAVAMPAGSTLAIFAVDVSCWSSTPVSEAGATVTLYRLQSTAAQGGVATSGYVERQIGATIVR